MDNNTDIYYSICQTIIDLNNPQPLAISLELYLNGGGIGYIQFPLYDDGDTFAFGDVLACTFGRFSFCIFLTEGEPEIYKTNKWINTEDTTAGFRGVWVLYDEGKSKFVNWVKSTYNYLFEIATNHGSDFQNPQTLLNEDRYRARLDHKSIDGSLQYVRDLITNHPLHGT